MHAWHRGDALVAEVCLSNVRAPQMILDFQGQQGPHVIDTAEVGHQRVVCARRAHDRTVVAGAGRGKQDRREEAEQDRIGDDDALEVLPARHLLRSG